MKVETSSDLLTAKADAARASIQAALQQGGMAAITCSFQAEDMVVLRLLQKDQPHVPVLFLDTGYHFAEMYAYRDQVAARFQLNLVNVAPVRTVAEQEAEFGALYRSRPDQCCKFRKVEPLFAALEGYDTWFTGLRRVQSPTRASLQVNDRFPLPSGKQLWKISPLADWSDQEVWAQAKAMDIPLISLYDAGYTSIGCEPCTSLPADPGNARSGRWAGRKLECGIHIAGAN